MKCAPSIMYVLPLTTFPACYLFSGHTIPYVLVTNIVFQGNGKVHTLSRIADGREVNGL